MYYEALADCSTLASTMCFSPFKAALIANMSTSSVLTNSQVDGRMFERCSHRIALINTHSLSDISVVSQTLHMGDTETWLDGTISDVGISVS